MTDAAGVEALFCKLFQESQYIVIGVVYRPPGCGVEVLEHLRTYMDCNTTDSTKLILCGDFNLPGINWSTLSADGSDVNNNEVLIDTAFQFDLTQLVKDFTRIHGASKSVLDLVFVSSRIPGEIKCDVVDGISDHKGVLTEFSSLLNESVVNVTHFPDFSAADDVSIIDRLEISYDEICNSMQTDECDVNSLWLKFKNTVHACIQLFVPVKYRKTNSSNPWITRETIHIKRKINRLRKQNKKAVPKSV